MLYVCLCTEDTSSLRARVLVRAPSPLYVHKHSKPKLRGYFVDSCASVKCVIGRVITHICPRINMMEILTHRFDRKQRETQHLQNKTHGTDLWNHFSMGT